MTRFLVAIFACFFLIAAAPAARADESLFNTTEISSPNLKSFTNWTGMLARFEHAEMLGEGLCASAAGPGAGGQCVWDEWQKIMAPLRDQPPMVQLKRVNDEMNKRRYTLDKANFGMEDYWQTVFEFLRENGDCEDYAIAKYLTLRALGWPADKLRIVVLRDTKLNLNHAVLAAYTDEGIYIGDNQVEGIVKASSIRHYRAIYSINEDKWWLHRPKAK